MTVAYVVITPARVRIFGSHARALKVLQRLRRMFPAGVYELAADAVRRGDPYRRTQINVPPMLRCDFQRRA